MTKKKTIREIFSQNNSIKSSINNLTNTATDTNNSQRNTIKATNHKRSSQYKILCIGNINILRKSVTKRNIDTMNTHSDNQHTIP